MKKITFVINGIEVSTRLNDNSELGKEKLLEDTKDLVPGDKEAIVKAVMALPRDPKSTISQYRVQLENVIVDGVPSKTNLVKLAASLIPDATAKLAVRESHYKNKSTSGAPAISEQATQDFKAWLLKNPNSGIPETVLAAFGIEDPYSTAIKALMAIGYSEEEAKKMAVMKK